MNDKPMTAREVNGILEMLDETRLSAKWAGQAAHELEQRGESRLPAMLRDAEKACHKAWDIAGGMLERGGWILGEGSETGVPKAMRLEPDANEAAKMQERLEMAGSAGEGAIPDESGDRV